MKTRELATAYARWIDRHRHRIVAASIVVVVLAGWLASRLSVEADLSYLLPPSAPSVQDLRAIERRAQVLGTVMVAVESGDPVQRARAARLLRERFLALPPGLISSVTFDDGVARRFAWEHRWLAASVADLTAARDALRAELRDARLRTNPLYVDLEDEAPPRRTDTDRLRARLREAERAKDATGELVGSDGRVQLMILRTAYPSGDIDRDQRLLEAVEATAAAVRREVTGVEIGAAGDVVLTVAEHDAILDGMVLAVIATVVLVLLGLLLYYRSLVAVAALSWSLVVGALVTFGFARLAVGHLNLATAFLSSIVIGNGINFGILLLARYMEERRAGSSGEAALAAALGGTVAGTLAAALTAAVAYGSLTLTSFRGFRDFGIIAGVGILPCWIAAYTVLPALIAIAARAGRLRSRAEPAIGALLARLAPRAPGARVLAMLVLTLVAGGLTYRYLAGDPFESDFRNLRSSSAAIDAESHWMGVVDRAFGQGISGGFVITVSDRAQTGPLVARLRALDVGKPEAAKLFSRLSSLEDLVPTDQPARLVMLAELRELLSDAAIDELDPEDRPDARALRPPADLRAIRDEDLPDELAWPYTEVDGSRGKLVLAMPGWGYDNWDARDIVRFARDVRGLDLGPGVLLGGSSFVFADMLELVDRDGPTATLASALGAILLVLLLVGRGRHGLVTLACGLTGTVSMLAFGSVLGLRVNFLDFVALPITIGIGIDYAVNLAARDRHEPLLGARALLARAGSAVLLCSFTTMVGYGSLLLSRNQGIRSFGAAAILGEATCLGAALLFAPALLGLARRRRH
ncbi:MAG: MMPL family transporter [Myxococcales bacterium]|nr:MMPL family transporter [Myxococcales bacterium]